jgi:hypothetical protein
MPYKDTIEPAAKLPESVVSVIVFMAVELSHLLAAIANPEDVALFSSTPSAEANFLLVEV